MLPLQPKPAMRQPGESMQPDATPSIEQVIALVPEWRSQPCQVQPLSGGLTNLNYQVQVGDQAFFVRIPGPQAELLAVDRRNEAHNSMLAASVGIAPRIVHYLEDLNVMVMEFIPGQTLNNTLMQTPGMIPRVAQSLRILHQAPPFQVDFDMFRLVEYYLQVVAEHQVRVPPDYHAWLPQLPRMEAALNRSPLPHVPCHNDLVAENFIDDGQLLRIVDFEYSGNNDPCFEMGDAITEIGFSHDQVVQLCAAYFGEAPPQLVARIRLYGIVSDIGWVLWTAIQNKISKIEFDFWSHMMFRWRRAVSLMQAPEYAGWLAAAGKGA